MTGKNIIINFNVHQPLRISPVDGVFYWEDRNQEVFKKSAQEYYLPTLEELAGTVRRHPEFRFSLGMSGTFLEQAENYAPAILSLISDLLHEGEANDQVELLDESYYSSLASFFMDDHEFRKQVSDQRTKIRDLFGVSPSTFRHTKRLYNDHIGNAIADMGFKVILADLSDKHQRSLYRAKGTNVMVIPRDVDLSHLVSRELLNDPVRYAKKVNNTAHDVVLMSYAIGRVGGAKHRGFWPTFADVLIEGKTGYFDRLFSRFGKDARPRLMNPAQLYEMIAIDDLPELSVGTISPEKWSSWKDAYADTGGLITNAAEYSLFKRIESLQGRTSVPADLQRQARNLTSFDHLRNLHNDPDSPAIRGNPYGEQVDATYVLTKKVGELEQQIEAAERNVRRARRRDKDVILSVTNELNNGGMLSRQYGYKTEILDLGIGGMSIVADNLANFFIDTGLEHYIATLDMPDRNKAIIGEVDLDEVKARFAGIEDRIFAAQSPVAIDVMNPYAEKNRLAAALQNYVAFTVLPDLIKRSRAAIILDMHDGMSAGILPDYARKLARESGRQIIPIFHSHNVHEVKIPLVYYPGIEKVAEVFNNAYFIDPLTKHELGGTLTGLTRSDATITVSPEWMRQLITGDVMQGFVPESFMHEFGIKHAFGQVYAVLNRPGMNMYPENNKFLQHPHEYIHKYGVDASIADLITPFGPDDSLEALMHAQASNKRAVQLMTGLRVDPEAVFIVYCGRLEPRQKNTDKLPHVLGTVIAYFEAKGVPVQALIQGDQTPDHNGQKPNEAHIRDFAWHSKSTVSYFPFNGFKELEPLAAGAADLYISPHNEEMCGNPDAVAYLNGVIGSFTNRGGPKDKGEQIRFKEFGATKDHGNVYFHEPNQESMIGQYIRAVNDIVSLRTNNKAYLFANKRRIMREARENLAPEHMGLETLAVYERVLGRKII